MPLGDIVRNLLINLKVDASSVSKGVGEAQKEFKGLDSSLEKLGGRLTGIGTGLTAAVTLPLAGAATAAFKFSKDFNSALANVASLDVPTARVNELRGSIQQLAIDTGKSTADIAAGTYQVISAFGDTADTVKILETNAKAAAAGLATTEEAIALTSAVTKGYGDASAEAVKHAADLAQQTVILGQTTFPELASSIGRVVPLASQLKVSQEELFAVMATATGVTGNAAEVSTQLRGVLQSLTAPTDTMVKLFKSLGIESGQALIEQRGLQGAIEAIVGSASASKIPLQDLIGSIEGQSLASNLATESADRLTKNLGKMGEATGTVDRAFKAQTEGVNALGFTFDQFLVRLEVVAQRLGDALAPAFGLALRAAEPLIAGIETAIGLFTELPAPIQTTIIALAGVAAAAGPVLVVLGTLATAASSLIGLFGTGGALAGSFAGFGAILAAVTGPVGIAVGIIAGLGVAVYSFRDDIADSRIAEIWQNTWDSIQGTLDDASDSLIEGLSNLTATLEATWEAGLFGLRPVIEGVWSGIGEIFAGALETIAAIVGGGLELIAQNINLFAKLITGDFSGAWEVSKDIFNTALRTIVEIVGAQVGAILGIIDGFSTSLGKSLRLKDAFDKEVDGVISSLKRVEPELKKQETLYNVVSGSVDGVISSWEELEEQGEKTNKPIKAFNGLLDDTKEQLDKLPQPIRFVVRSEQDLEAQTNRVGEEWRRLRQEQINPLLSSLPTFERSIEDVGAAAKRQAEEFNSLTGFLDAYQLTMSDTELAQLNLGNALGAFGIKAKSVADKELRALRDQLDVIREQAAKNNPDALAALSEAEKKYADALKSSGGAVEATGLWGDALKQVSTVFTDFGKAIATDIGSHLKTGIGIIDSMTEALLRMVSERVFGAVIKNFQTLQDFIPSLENIKGLLGSIKDALFGTAAQSIPSIPIPGGTPAPVPGGAPPIPGTDPAGTVGGTASGTLGTIASVTGIVTGIVSAVTGVIGLFQNARQENTLNAIEESTRRGTLFLGDRSDGGILGVAFRILEEVQFGTFVKVLEQIRDDVRGTIAPAIAHIAAAGVMVAGLATVAANTEATANNTSETATNTATTAENTSELPELPENIALRSRGAPSPTGVEPTSPSSVRQRGAPPVFVPGPVAGRTRTGSPITSPVPETGVDEGALAELQRRNPLAFGSNNPFAIQALGGAITEPLQGIITAVETGALETNTAVIDLGDVFRARIDRSNLALDQINAGIQAGAARPFEIKVDLRGATFSDEQHSQRTIDYMFARARSAMKGIS